MQLETLAVHAGRPPEPHTGAITPAISLSTTFERAADGSESHGYTYTRSDNPNRRAWEEALAVLEGGKTGLAFASGLAAIGALLQTLSAGAHVLLPADLYHGTRHLALDIWQRWGLAVDLVDMRSLEQVAAALRPTTRLLWLETPSNPQLDILDIQALAQLAQAAGALCAVDNTWATPIWQRPLALGADVVMHSATKYLGGHSDVLGGALVLRDGPDSPLTQQLRAVQSLSGAVPSPFDCWLLLRSLPTLPVRVRAQTESAGRLAVFLHHHPRVHRVNYPGLPTHPGHALARRQMQGFGAMLSFEVEGGAPAALAVAGRVGLWTRATSLGGVESLIEHRASVEGPDSPTPAGLLRLSVGLEHVQDLLADLAQALDAG